MKNKVFEFYLLSVMGTSYNMNAPMGSIYGMSYSGICECNIVQRNEGNHNAKNRF